MFGRYPPVAEHGPIGDLQTAALVSTDGTVDWFCCPRLTITELLASSSTITGALSTMTADVKTTVNGIDALDGAADLNDAFASAENCQQVGSTGDGRTEEDQEADGRRPMTSQRTERTGHITWPMESETWSGCTRPTTWWLSSGASQTPWRRTLRSGFR